MLNISKYVGFVFGAAILLAGCKGKDGEPGPAGGSQTGNIVGFVNGVVDEFGQPQTKSGITVALENTNPAITTMTDTNGRYELTNVKSGTYNIAFSKAGFGTTKVQGYPHVGGGQATFIPNYTLLLGISGTTVPTFSISAVIPQSPSNESLVRITATLANPNSSSLPGNSLFAMGFVGNSASVTYLTGEFMTGVYSSSGPPPYLTRTALNRRGFATGSTAYAIIYGAPNYNYDYSYIDLATGRGIYTCLSTMPSRVVSFIVP